MELSDKTLRILSCDMSIRPRSAAGIAELLPFLRKVDSKDDKVLFHFHALGSAVVESFVSAERLCCTSLAWDLVPSDDQVILIVGGTIEQVSEIKKWFEPQ